MYRPLPPVAFLAECFTLDPETGRLYWRRRPAEHFSSSAAAQQWSTAHAGRPALETVGSKGYLGGEVVYAGLRRRLRAHRVVFVLHHGHEPEQVDHVNGNRSDNRPANLREADVHTNRHNSRYGFGKALPRGVFVKDGGFVARIRNGGVERRLGVFRTPEEAGEAYEREARRVYGDFYRDVSPQRRVLAGLLA